MFNYWHFLNWLATFYTATRECTLLTASITSNDCHFAAMHCTKYFHRSIKSPAVYSIATIYTIPSEKLVLQGNFATASARLAAAVSSISSLSRGLSRHATFPYFLTALDLWLESSLEGVLLACRVTAVRCNALPKIKNLTVAYRLIRLSKCREIYRAARRLRCFNSCINALCVHVLFRVLIPPKLVDVYLASTTTAAK